MNRGVTVRICDNGKEVKKEGFDGGEHCGT